MFRTREKNEHSCGGIPCSGLGRGEKECNRFSEVKTELTSCQQNLDKITQNLANITGENKRLNEKMCTNVLCNNGGTCKEGECICTDGFSGNTCAEKGRSNKQKLENIW